MSSGSAADAPPAPASCDLGQIAFLFWTSVSHLWNGQIELEALGGSFPLFFQAFSFLALYCPLRS